MEEKDYVQEPKILYITGFGCITAGVIANMPDVGFRKIRYSSDMVFSGKNWENYKVKVFRAMHSNNWLRVHGYPMKRRKI